MTYNRNNEIDKYEEIYLKKISKRVPHRRVLIMLGKYSLRLERLCKQLVFNKVDWKLNIIDTTNYHLFYKYGDSNITLLAEEFELKEYDDRYMFIKKKKMVGE